MIVLYIVYILALLDIVLVWTDVSINMRYKTNNNYIQRQVYCLEEDIYCLEEKQKLIHKELKDLRKYEKILNNQIISLKRLVKRMK